MEETFQIVREALPFLFKGMYFTVILSLGGMFFGFLLGFGLALMRLSRFKVLNWIARIYVSFFRGTPLLVQLFVIYYGLPQVGLELDPIPAALIGLSLNMAAYICEILRSSISSIERGQWEAAASIGMTCRRWVTASFHWSRTRHRLPPFKCRSCYVKRS
jgi:cystine transport system permease protein